MEKINTILVEMFKVSMEEANKDLGMTDIANWDSLTHMNLIVTIEDEFGIELSGDDIAEMISFDQIRATVAKYL